MRRSIAALVVLGSTLVAGCGGSAGDLLALEVSGGAGRAPVRLTVTDDGRARCGDGELEPITNERLIEARDIERDLEGLAEEGASFENGERAGRRSYVARTRAGTVRWDEGVPDLPEVLPRAALLAQELESELCGGGALNGLHPVGRPSLGALSLPPAGGPAQERTLPLLRARSLARST